MPAQSSTASNSSREEAVKKRKATSRATQEALTPTGALPEADLQRVTDLRAVRPPEILRLQRKLGNRAVTQLIQARFKVSPTNDRDKQDGDLVADQAMHAPLATASAVQNSADREEDEVQAKLIQRLPASSPSTPQHPPTETAATSVDHEVLQAQRPNHTGLPDNLKTGVENLSGFSLDDIRVHRDSDKPAQLSAHAYAQGTEIYLAPGQEKHLPHETWHVVQQKQGRVQPTLQTKGVKINDDMELESEADGMGAKATSLLPDSAPVKPGSQTAPLGASDRNNVQRKVDAQSSTNVIQLYPVTGEWLKNMFGGDHITACRQTMGEEAFQYFLKLQTEEMTPLVDFFKAQPQPIVSPREQGGLLVPLRGAPDLLALMKEALTKTQFNPTLASPIYDLLAPLAGAPSELTLMREALTLTNNNPVAAPAIKNYLAKYQAKGAKALAAAREKLKAKGNDPVVADQVMTDTEDYNYHESVKNQVEKLGNQKATEEYTVAVEDNRQKRESYLTSYTDTAGVDFAQPDEPLAETLGEKKATTEYTTALEENTLDRETFISGFKEKTGYEHTTTFTRKQMEKPLQNQQLHAGLKFFFPTVTTFTVAGVKDLIANKLKELDEREILLGNSLPGNKTKYKKEVTKKLGEFSAKKGKLDTDLEVNKANYKNALKQAITPLFAFPESEAASEWVLTTAGADDKKATKLVTWILNGLNAQIALTDIQKIFKIFSLEQVAGFYAPAGGTDAKAQALLQLLNVAKMGEDVKFKTLIERDDLNDFTELLTFLKKANSSIDRALTIFSKKDSSKKVNKLLGDLTRPTVADPLQESEDYLKHKGKAADASFLVAGNVLKADAEALLAKDWIVGHGEQVAHIYTKSGNNVTRTIAVLDILKTAAKPQTPVDVKKWLDFNHTFTNIHNKLQADKDQQFWAGEACAENTVPVVNRLGQIDNINTVIASCYAVKTVGQFYSGGGFGNLGNGAGQPTVMVLPDNVGYREYDIKPYKDDPGRGKKRIVVGGGNYYYTGDHYETFTRFRP
jgi:hypothetical protein